MISDDHLTHLIRTLFVAGENEALFPDARAALEEMVAVLDEWKNSNAPGSEMPVEISRIQRVVDYLEGKTVSVGEDPWIAVSQIQMNYENRSGEIDLLPAMQVAGLIRNWEGQDGHEPDWLIEGDRLLCLYWYPNMITGFELNGPDFDDYLDWSPRERASTFNFLG
jgi:hypothetical protein